MRLSARAELDGELWWYITVDTFTGGGRYT